MPPRNKANVVLGDIRWLLWFVLGDICNPVPGMSSCLQVGLLLEGSDQLCCSISLIVGKTLLYSYECCSENTRKENFSRFAEACFGRDCIVLSHEVIRVSCAEPYPSPSDTSRCTLVRDRFSVKTLASKSQNVDTGVLAFSVVATSLLEALQVLVTFHQFLLLPQARHLCRPF